MIGEHGHEKPCYPARAKYGCGADSSLCTGCTDILKDDTKQDYGSRGGDPCDGFDVGVGGATRAMTRRHPSPRPPDPWVYRPS